MERDILKHLPKAVGLKEALKREISMGVFGSSGDNFLSVRALAKRGGVSLVTAHRVMSLLKEDGCVVLKNKHHLIGDIPKFVPGDIGEAKERKKLIGLMLSNLENPFFASISRQVKNVASQLGYDVLIGCGDYDFLTEKRALETFVESGCAGVLSCPGTNLNTCHLYAEYELPYVFLGRKLEGLSADVVMVNQTLAAQMIAEHFIALGFKNFAYVGIEELARDSREMGFKSQLGLDGYSLSAENIVKFSNQRLAEGGAGLLEFVRDLPKPVAIACFHDLLAARTLNVCQALGFKVPEDVAISGFDDLPISRHSFPAITTVRYPVGGMVESALDRLLRKIDTRHIAGNVVQFFEPTLMVRGSSEAKPMVDAASINSKSLLYQVV